MAVVNSSIAGGQELILKIGWRRKTGTAGSTSGTFEQSLHDHHHLSAWCFLQTLDSSTFKEEFSFLSPTTVWRFLQPFWLLLTERGGRSSYTNPCRHPSRNQSTLRGHPIQTWFEHYKWQSTTWIYPQQSTMARAHWDSTTISGQSLQKLTGHWTIRSP